MAKIERAYVAGRFGQVHLRRAGLASQVAPPVVCFHGNPMSGRAFEPLIGHLGDSRLAIAMDTPGFGMSDPPPAAPDMDGYAAAMGDAIDALGLQQVDLIGWHTGSRIATALAEQRPALVRRVILMGAPVYTPEQIEAGGRYKGLAATADGAHLADEWVKWGAFWPHDAPGNQHNDLFADMMLGIGAPHRDWLVPANMAYRYPDHLPGLTQPVWVLNPQGGLHDATVRVAPYIREGGVIEIERNMYELMSVGAAALADIIAGLLA